MICIEDLRIDLISSEVDWEKESALATKRLFDLRVFCLCNVKLKKFTLIISSRQDQSEL